MSRPVYRSVTLGDYGSRVDGRCAAEEDDTVTWWAAKYARAVPRTLGRWVVVVVLATLGMVAAAVVSEPAAHAEVPDPVAIPTRSADRFTALIAYSFGNRIPAGVDAKRQVGQPGPVNEALAAAVVKARGSRSIPVYAQTEIAEVLAQRYHLPGVVEIPPDRNPDGTLKYLSTDGVAAKVASLRGSAARSDIVGVIAFADHQWRAVYTTRVNGLDAYAPAGVAMPATYDTRSGQSWTRSRVAYLPTDYAARIALLPRLIGARR